MPLLLLDIRAMTCDALPLSVWHLYPRIGPALIRIERLSQLIGALALEDHADRARDATTLADHVGIGQDVAVLGNDEARALALPADRKLTVGIVGARKDRADLDDAANAPFALPDETDGISGDNSKRAGR